jgi:hypothetical protein
MASVSSTILRSMRLTGEKSRGGTLDANEQVECLAELNTFMESCYTERLLAPSIREDSVSLSASTRTLTVGPGGQFNITRPMKIIEPCFTRDSSGFDSPIKVIDFYSYESLRLKSVGYTYPNALYYDQGFSATSTGKLYLYPLPIGGLTLYINSWQQLGNFSTLSQQMLLPPGYQLFVESNFAIHLASGIIPISPELAKIAKESKAAIKGLNSYSPIMQMDTGIASGSPRSSILTGP